MTPLAVWLHFCYVTRKSKIDTNYGYTLLRREEEDPSRSGASATTFSSHRDRVPYAFQWAYEHPNPHVTYRPATETRCPSFH